jgi:hypothetical protein
MKPGAGTTAISLKRQATSDKLQATSNKLQGTKILITQPEGLRQIVARQNDAGAISRKQQATSDKRQAPGFRIQAASVKRQAYLKIFLCLNIPGALVHASGLRIPGSGSLSPHKVLER